MNSESKSLTHCRDNLQFILWGSFCRSVSSFTPESPASLSFRSSSLGHDEGLNLRAEARSTQPLCVTPQLGNQQRKSETSHRYRITHSTWQDIILLSDTWCVMTSPHSLQITAWILQFITEHSAGYSHSGSALSEWMRTEDRALQLSSVRSHKLRLEEKWLYIRTQIQL